MLKDLSIKHLGQLIDLNIKASEYGQAQKCLDEIQSRIPVRAKSQAMSDDARLDLSDYPQAEPIPACTTDDDDDDDELVDKITSEPAAGPLRDDQGNVTRISALPAERGYDPDAHENKALKIFCDGVHIPTAHTADTVEGLVRK